MRRSASATDNSAISSPLRSRTPSVSLTRMSLSAFRAMATLAATSSMVRLNASPVGENPSGDSSTSALLASVYFSASTSTLRTTPVCWKSMPSTMPSGRAVTKLPLITRMRELAIGVFWQALREGGLDVEADLAGGLLGALERPCVGDAHAAMKARLQSLQPHLRLNLRPRSVHQHQADAHRMQQRQVVHQRRQTPGLDQFAAEADHERAAAMRVHVRRDVAQPGDELRARIGCGGVGEVSFTRVR